MMIGARPDEVIVKPNLSFIDATLTPQEAASRVKLWQDGAVSYQTLYENLQRGEIASAERDHEAELILIDKEDIGSDPAEAGLLSAPQ